MDAYNYKKSFRKVGFLILGFLFMVSSLAGSTVLYAQEETDKTYAIDAPQEAIDYKKIEREKFIYSVRSELRATQKELYDVNANVTDTENRLDEVYDTLTTLSGQVASLDKLIRETEQMIVNVRVQISEKESQLRILYSEMEVNKAAIENQKTMLLEYLETIYLQENEVVDTLSDNENINVAKLVLSDETIAEQLQQIRYFNVLEETGHEIFSNLEAMMTRYEADEKYVDRERIELEALSARLEQEMENLELQKKAKQHLLEQTRGEESIFRELLEESKKQQEQIQDDINLLRDNLRFIEGRMAVLGDAFDPENYKSIFSGDKVSVYEFINETKDETDVEFIWPVSAKGGISAYFRDPSYAAVFGVRHNAIDIRVVQESTIRAAADGVVYRVRDNGYGYSYLMIAHKGGYMTVYGHIPEFFVEEGEEVKAGQPVALSGGMPGTKGAGLMTTGPHLHFEMLKGGSYIDPLFYLPLSELPVIPEKYNSIVTHQVAQPSQRIKRGSEA